jgi:hypothetical protein
MTRMRQTKNGRWWSGTVRRGAPAGTRASRGGSGTSLRKQRPELEEVAVARAQAGGWGGGLRRTLDNEDEADGEGAVADRRHLSWRRRLSWAGVRGSAFQTAWLSVNFAKQPSHCLSCFQKNGSAAPGTAVYA